MKDLAELLTRAADTAPVPSEGLIGSSLLIANARARRRRRLQAVSVGVLAAALLMGAAAVLSRSDDIRNPVPGPAAQTAKVDVTELEESGLVSLAPPSGVPTTTARQAIEVALRGLPAPATSVAAQVPGAELFDVTSRGIGDGQNLLPNSRKPGVQVRDRLTWVVTFQRQAMDQPLYVFVDATTGGRMFGISAGLPAEGDASSLTDRERSMATLIARREQRKVLGTFVGATAFSSRGAPFDPDSECDDGTRHVNIRLVWEAGANFTHSSLPGGGQADGSRQGLLITVDPRTSETCETGAMFREVGAGPDETLLYGVWPDPAAG